ncbi:unnamed protein product [Moneuplotes crassus]|uniref:non-specific serine/threonine protein kinase n=1 Tax=Euplotes crassus TaxID=5936 RepID=A0AAD1UD33_EUPCR|nr:unnamed protein product [Moneuplotes crassus]
MEFARNGDIRHKIEAALHESRTTGIHHFIDENEIWKIFIQCLKGLNELHLRGICHRDIKSANLFVQEGDIVKLGDFNASIVLKESHYKNQNGTPYYAAPEIWFGKSTDSKCDIWSLGCCIYELMFLRVPFSAKESKELFSKITEGNIDQFVENHPYSEHLINMVLWTLTLDPNMRPSAKDILDSYPMRGMREILLNDIEYIDSYKPPKLKAPVFLPSDRSKLNRRILSKVDDSYKFTPSKPKYPTDCLEELSFRLPFKLPSINKKRFTRNKQNRSVLENDAKPNQNKAMINRSLDGTVTFKSLQERISSRKKDSKLKNSSIHRIWNRMDGFENKKHAPTGRERYQNDIPKTSPLVDPHSGINSSVPAKHSLILDPGISLERNPYRIRTDLILSGLKSRSGRRRRL